MNGRRVSLKSPRITAPAARTAWRTVLSRKCLRKWESSTERLVLPPSVARSSPTTTLTPTLSKRPTVARRQWLRVSSVCCQDRVVFTYQGDGDLASIGMGEIVHAAARGENISVIFINNANYGMTGGQMAPTTLPGMKTTSSPSGRDVETQGYPIRMCEMLSTLDGAGYVVRRSLHDPKNIRLAKKAIRLAFETQNSRSWFLHGGIALDVPNQLEHDARGSPEVCRRQDGVLLPSGRLQGFAVRVPNQDLMEH